MRRVYLVSGVLLVLCVVFAPTVFSQDQGENFDFKRAYEDFVYTYDQYRTQHSDYELARSQYIQSKTLASKAKAQTETYEMLSARDEAVKTYLTMLRMRLAEAVGVPQDTLTILYNKIDTEHSWYDTHKNQLSSAASLEDQITDSNKAKTRYESITNPIDYEVLTHIALGKEYVLRQQLIAVMEDLKTKLNDIRANNDLDTQRIERDLLEVENRIARSQEKRTELDKKVSEIARSRDPLPIYNEIQFRLGESIQYLKEANTYLKQIIIFIKNG